MRRFLVTGELGKGGFGRVFRVIEEGSDMAPALALKLLSGAWRDDDPVRRLRDEARLLARLRHPGIVRLYSFVRLDAGPGLLMELVEGPNLNEVLKATGRLPHAAALELVAAVAEALNYAWELPGDEGQPLHLLHPTGRPPALTSCAPCSTPRATQSTAGRPNGECGTESPQPSGRCARAVARGLRRRLVGPLRERLDRPWSKRPTGRNCIPDRGGVARSAACRPTRHSMRQRP